MNLANGLVHQKSPSTVAQLLQVPIIPLTHLLKVKDTIPIRNADFILSHSHDKMNVSLFLGHDLVVKPVKPFGHKPVGVVKPVKPVGHASFSPSSHSPMYSTAMFFFFKHAVLFITHSFA